MNDPATMDTLVSVLATLPDYKNPLNTVYDVLSRSPERPLTLRTIRQHSQLLHDHADRVRDQTFAVNRVIASCQKLSPTPLAEIPCGF